jgi:putative ABC transport system permease protein
MHFSKWTQQNKTKNMVTIFLKSFLRHLKANKVYTLVTLLGFSISLTFVILLSVYIKDEYSVNSFHVNKDRIYRLRNETGSGFPPPIGQVLKDNYPEIESYTRVFMHEEPIRHKDNIMKFNMLLVDSAFFNIFSFNLLEGDPTEGLKTTNSIVLTKEYAYKLFGNEPAIGKEVLIGNNVNCIITGIVDNVHENSSFSKCDGLVNFNCIADIWNNPGLLTSNGNSSFDLYLLTKANTNLPGKAAQIVEMFKKDFWIYQEGRAKEVIFEPLEDVYFSKISSYRGSTKSNSETLIILLVAIVISILVLAIINYLNLTIAQSGFRLKEMAIKKISGSSFFSLIKTQVFESMLLCALAFVMAVIMSILIQPAFNQLFDGHINLINEINLKSAGYAIMFIIGFGCFTGIIPAIILTKFNIPDVLKGYHLSISKGVYTKYLIGFQYVIVLVLLISTMLIAKQTHFLKNHNPGYRTNKILSLENVIGGEQRAGLRDKLMSVPGVREVSYVRGTPVDGGNNQSFMYNDKPVSFQEFTVDSVFFKIMDLEVEPTGAAYSKNGMWLNQAAVSTLELEPSPTSFKRYNTDVPVLGIIKDFNFGSLHNKIGPIMIGQMDDNWWAWSILVQIEGNNLLATVEQIKDQYSSYSGGLPFDYSFIDETINSWYIKEVRTNKIIAGFSFLTIVITCMGLFAMSIFYMQKKTKEIGIRKVNGAKIWEVMLMLNIDFVKWVAIAFVIATPIAYYAMSQWLQKFAYKTELSWWIFALAGLLALGIALLTVSWQSWQAARRNPVEALRYE